MCVPVDQKWFWLMSNKDNSKFLGEKKEKLGEMGKIWRVMECWTTEPIVKFRLKKTSGLPGTGLMMTTISNQAIIVIWFIQDSKSLEKAWDWLVPIHMPTTWHCQGVDKMTTTSKVSLYKRLLQQKDWGHDIKEVWFWMAPNWQILTKEASSLVLKF